MQWQTIWSFKTKRFVVNYAIAPEDDLDLSWDDTGEVRQKLESGEYTAFVARIAVYLDGNQIAEQYLGNCIYERPEEFRDHIGLAAKSRQDARNYGSYFSSMVLEAIKEARGALTNIPHLRSV